MVSTAHGTGAREVVAGAASQQPVRLQTLSWNGKVGLRNTKLFYLKPVNSNYNLLSLVHQNYIINNPHLINLQLDKVSL